MGGKIIPRIRLTLAKVLVEVEAELGNMWLVYSGQHLLRGMLSSEVDKKIVAGTRGVPQEPSGLK